MGPRNTTRNLGVGQSTKGTATPTADTLLIDNLATAQQLEIERLTGLLRTTQEQLEQAQLIASATPAPEQNLTTLVETLVRALSRTSSSPASSKSSKVPDPPLLTDGKDPSFISWKKQMIGKLTVNADHFANETARINYIFSRTGRDAQEHLQPKLGDDAVEAFKTAEEMLQHLSGIYEDPFRVENAKRDYRKLYIKSGETLRTSTLGFYILPAKDRS